MILKIIKELGYKVIRDSEEEIYAKHGLSMMYYPHELIITFTPNPEGISIKFKIEHWAAKSYLNKIGKKFESSILKDSLNNSLKKNKRLESVVLKPPVRKLASTGKWKVKKPKEIKEKIKLEHKKSKFFIGKNVKEKWIREIQERVISPDEELIAVIKGAIESEWAPLTPEVDKSKKGFVMPRSGVLGCTTHKIFFYMPKILGRWEVETAPLDQISSIQFTKGLIEGRIHLTVFNDEKVIKWIDNEDGAIMTKIIEKECIKMKEMKKVTRLKEEDPVKILKIRFAKGEISKEEYEEMKKILES
ncbi:PH domain-containing protein [Candidatus Bathyarchaeota archaeon]|nr:PH domain-containing protein [Candidatus Bathyarchaeota archaeon]